MSLSSSSYPPPHPQLRLPTRIHPLSPPPPILYLRRCAIFAAMMIMEMSTWGILREPQFSCCLTFVPLFVSIDNRSSGCDVNLKTQTLIWDVTFKYSYMLLITDQTIISGVNIKPAVAVMNVPEAASFDLRTVMSEIELWLTYLWVIGYYLSIPGLCSHHVVPFCQMIILSCMTQMYCRHNDISMDTERSSCFKPLGIHGTQAVLWKVLWGYTLQSFGPNNGCGVHKSKPDSLIWGSHSALPSQYLVALSVVVPAEGVERANLHPATT